MHTSGVRGAVLIQLMSLMRPQSQRLAAALSRLRQQSCVFIGEESSLGLELAQFQAAKQQDTGDI